MLRTALIAPDARRAARTARMVRATRGELVPFSLRSFLAGREDFDSIVIAPGNGGRKDAAAFVERVARRLLWPPPSARLAAAIAGLRDEPVRGGRRSAGNAASGLLLEGAVTSARVRRILARADLSRDWIVEDPRHVRLSERELARTTSVGVRWFALRPLTLAAVVSDFPVRRQRPGADGLLPRRVPGWKLRRARG